MSQISTINLVDLIKGSILRCLVLFLFLILSCTDAQSSRSNQAQPLAKITSGKITYHGKFRSQEKVEEYLGIPFAQPPIGGLRWRPAQALTQEASHQYREARTFAPACMQGTHISNWYKGVIESFGGAPESFPTPEVSEDCLYLNLWRPSSTGTEALPIMVYVHGGSNKGGWTYEPNYVGAKLASLGAVVITIPYRLGVFGFFSHSELEQANFALTDLLVGLNWISQHAHAFGGDANNITLFGESAGASNIAYLMAMPQAKGLFQKVVHQSAGWAMYATERKEKVESLGAEFSKAAGAPPTSQLEYLRSLSSERVLALAESTYADFFFDPVIDDYTIFESLFSSFKKGRIAEVDLLIGNNSNEARMYLPYGASIESLLLSRNPGLNPNRMNEIETYLDSLDSLTSLQKLDLLATSYDYACPSLEMAKYNGISGKQSWYYYFTQVRDGELGASMGAYHGAELPYVFDTHDDWLPINQSDIELTQRINEYWLNFARHGTPNGTSRSTNNETWLAFSDTKSVQYLGKNIRSSEHPSWELCQLLKNEDDRK